MFRQITGGMSAIIFLFIISTAIAVPPESASVSGVVNVGWPAGDCMVDSFGQLVIQRDPNIIPADILVRAGVCTQSVWGGYTLADHPRFIEMGKRVDAAHLFGLGYSVAWKPGNTGPYGIANQADSLTIFKNADEAVYKLKELIAAGIPVQVHMDMAWLAGFDGVHGSHFVVVRSYDANGVYYCDNGFADGEYENVPLSWANFLAGWSAIADLSPEYPNHEYFMLWLTAEPVTVDSDWVLAWLVRDVDVTNTTKRPTGPDAIRASAAAIRNGADPGTAFDSGMRSSYSNLKPYLIEFLNNAGHSDIADSFKDACDIWKTIQYALDIDSDTLCGLMEDAADIEEGVQSQMLALGEDLTAVYLCSPEEDANLATLEDCTFRWAQMPDVSSAVLQLSMTSDFNDTRNVVVLKPNKYKKFVVTTQKGWLKMLAKNGGGRQLLWRVGGLGKEASKVSVERVLRWDVQQMSSTSPDDDYTMTEDELVTFTFESLWIATNPCVVISATGDFNDMGSRVVLKPKKGQTGVSFKTKTLSVLRKKDDGDGIVYWRVEDASSKKTKVEPSDARSLNLP
jgi:hypothetical protein